MKKYLYIIASAAAMLFAAHSASAQQSLRSGYFLDGYTYNYRLNPAFNPNRGFVSMPVLGNLSIGLESNMGLSTFLYPTESGQLTTFLSPAVDDKTYLKSMNRNNNLNLNIDETLIAFGFRTKKSYHTVDVSLKAGAKFNVPRGLFDFMKIGSSDGNTSWDISNLGLRGNGVIELAYGYSRPILDWIKVGARVKVLVGLANADLKVKNMNISMDETEWAVKAQGSGFIAAPVSFETTEDNLLDLSSGTFDLNGILNYIKSPSMGFAVDLGASFDFLEYFTASVSVLDLGFMNWKSVVEVETPEKSFSFTGFENFSGSLDDQLGTMTEGLGDLMNLEVLSNGGKRSRALAATIHAGVEARMPFYQRLSFGLLYTQKIEGAYSWSEGRLSANIAPTNWLSATTSYAVSNFGHSWGLALNIHLKGFGLFLGTDSFAPFLNVTPQYIPIGPLNTSFQLGINFPFGKYNGRFPKKA